MKKKRIRELEKKISKIDTEYQPLMRLFFKWKAAFDAGDTKAAEQIREDANGWFKNNDGQFNKLAYFPPDGSSGVVSDLDWLKFVKYNFNKKHRSL